MKIQKLGDLLKLPKSDGTIYVVHPDKIASVQSTDKIDQCTITEHHSRYFCRVDLAPDVVQQAIEEYLESL